MDDTFFINIDYQGTTQEFEGRLHVLGYIYKIELDIYGKAVYFELDEERKYRATAAWDQINEKLVTNELLKAISERLEALLKF
jgi:phosphoribosylformylglycinamidine (FGAM) synthase PurS component